MNFNNYVEGQEKDILRRATYSGNYMINNIQNSTEEVYPYSPTIIMQKSGGVKVSPSEITDVSSELLNITRKTSNDPTEKWMPSKQKHYQYINMPDGLFNQDSTLLTDPPMLLKEQTKNRWETLPLDPQENAIEPFKRNGDDTYLSLIDNWKC